MSQRIKLHLACMWVKPRTFTFHAKGIMREIDSLSLAVKVIISQAIVMLSLAVMALF